MPEERVPSSKKIRYLAAANEQHQSYIQCTSSLPLEYQTIGHYLQLTAQKFPTKKALVSCHEGLQLTYSEVLDKADRLAAAFYQVGLERGDRVAIWAPNCSAYYLATFAVARADMISLGLNPAFQLPELEHALNKVDATALIMVESFRDRNMYDAIKDLLPELTHCSPGSLKSSRVPSLKTVIIDCGDRTYPGSFSFQELLNLATEQQIGNIEAIQTSISPDSGAYLLLTSGSTGQPKAALLSHFAIVNNAIHSAHRNELDCKDHRICLHVPLFHAFGLVNGLFSALNYGNSVVLPSAAFKGSDSLKAIINEKCTVVYGTPTMFVDIIAEFRNQNLKSLPVDLAIVGGASCSPQLLLSIQNTLSIRCVRTGYGMTETTGVAFLGDRGNKTGSLLNTVGRIMDHYEAKVVDSEGKVVSFGMAGELLIRGYGIMLGYWGDDLKTKQVLSNDGWLRTGDQFVLQPDEYGQIVSRIKEIIIRGGENIYPKEVEDVLNSIPEILESYCIGVPDERLGEEVCAYVRVADLVEDEQFDLERMKLFCQDKLAYFKIPKHLRIVEEMPKTSTGKIQKMELLKMFLSENK